MGEKGRALELYDRIMERLSAVTDPETKTDVVKMRLVEQLKVDEDGRVSFTFQPSSPFCPIAVFLV